MTGSIVFDGKEFLNAIEQDTMDRVSSLITNDA